MDKSGHIVPQFQVHSSVPTKRGLPSIAYRELPLQITPVAHTLFGGTVPTLVRHFAVGLVILYDLSFKYCGELALGSILRSILVSELIQTTCHIFMTAIAVGLSYFLTT